MLENNYSHEKWNPSFAEDKEQFQKYIKSDAAGEPYDFGSVLHYGTNDFAKDPNKWTIKPKSSYSIQKISQRVQLSDDDTRKSNKMYQCNQPSTTPSPESTAVVLQVKFDTM